MVRVNKLLKVYKDLPFPTLVLTALPFKLKCFIPYFYCILKVQHKSLSKILYNLISQLSFILLA